MLLHKLIEFVVDYFTNLTPRKVVAGVLLLVGLFLVMQVRAAGSVDNAIVYGVAGIFVGGIGVTLILYENVRSTHFSDLDVVARANDLEKRSKSVESWYMEEVAHEQKTDKEQN